MDYLIHYNKNHDKLGRFASGDGNGDGVVVKKKQENKKCEFNKE